MKDMSILTPIHATQAVGGSDRPSSRQREAQPKRTHEPAEQSTSAVLALGALLLGHRVGVVSSHRS